MWGVANPAGLAVPLVGLSLLLSQSWFSGRTLKTRNSVRKQGLFPRRERHHCPLGSLAPCLSQLLERDFGDAAALLDGIRVWE